MGQFDTDAWYLVIFSDRNHSIYSYTRKGYSKEEAIGKISLFFDQNFPQLSPIKTIVVYYCGQVEPQKEELNG